MEAIEKERWIKFLKESPIQIISDDFEESPYEREQIEQLIPHRPPFALVERITNIDLAHKVIIAETRILEDDPVFKGHFPEMPVYPGVLQVEMMGQAGLCLIYFLNHNSTRIDPEKPQVKGMFTRIHHSAFMRPVLPGDLVTIRAQVVEKDDFLGILAVQLYKGGQICANSILEAYFMD